MSATNQQIVELAKRGFDATQIETALNLPVGSASQILAQDSGAMREISRHNLDDKFASLEEKMLNALELNLFDENGSVRQRAVEFIAKQRFGLLKPRERLTVNNNIQFLLNRVQEAKKLRDETAIDVEVQPA